MRDMTQDPKWLRERFIEEGVEPDAIKNAERLRDFLDHQKLSLIERWHQDRSEDLENERLAIERMERQTIIDEVKEALEPVAERKIHEMWADICADGETARETLDPEARLEIFKQTKEKLSSFWDDLKVYIVGVVHKLFGERGYEVDTKAIGDIANNVVQYPHDLYAGEVSKLKQDCTAEIKVIEKGLGLNFPK